MKVLSRIALLFLAALFCGCGGGSGTGGASGGGGRASITIKWPARAAAVRSKLIPVAANSVKVTFRDGAAIIASQVLARPPDGSDSVSNFLNLPIRALLVDAAAYPTADGTGVAQATATVPVPIP